MKNSGIIRRIDDLGRIVIPKDVRKRLGIKEGTPVEINIENDTVVLVPYLSKAERLKRWERQIFARMDKDIAQWEFTCHGSAIVCLRKDDCFQYYTSVGVAVCAPNDTYDEVLGKCIAYCRAANVPIDDAVFE